MSKSLYIAEKPSVARDFAAALKENMKRFDGYMESEQSVITWCYGHLVTMSYPEAYDPKLKRWSLNTLPFLPEKFKYEVIASNEKQFRNVSALLNRPDVDVIYICTDSGREGEYIYRLVDQMAQVKGKERKRVWIDSQTEEEILRGIREAKDWSEYDNLSASAYLRAKEDYLMGINFSRLLTLKYGNALAAFLHQKYAVISVGRVMTCVLGMVVRREREIRNFVKTPFYRVAAGLEYNGFSIDSEWKAVEGSRYFGSPKLYKDNGFRRKEDAQELIDTLRAVSPQEMTVSSVTRKTEKKNPPLLYNLAELQNDCARFFKISPEETLKIVQELYERKLVTYPRTDARVLSSAIAKEIDRNLRGLRAIPGVKDCAEQILASGSYKKIGSGRYVNDSQITDHYAIIPTGQGFSALRGLPAVSSKVYEVIVRRFLAIFYPPAEYQRIRLTADLDREKFFAGFKVLRTPGYQTVMKYSFLKKKKEEKEDGLSDGSAVDALATLKKGMKLPVTDYAIREGETSPPKRYNSGSIILAMENAGQLIEDEELREQIRGCGIGTSATRSGILEKLIRNRYLTNNRKTQIITPMLQGELIYDIVESSIRSLLNPELTASWEKGLTYVAEGSITEQEYMDKLEAFIQKKTSQVLQLHNQYQISEFFRRDAGYYSKQTNRSPGRRAAGDKEKQ
ncbi:MAG: DNA topoisomerase [Lachnospiraceae bacterium]|jgi:DNA topoisomerase-3|nr:DNA topoisomerase [Lachnospiraceae bacterium]MCI1656723.1 DNA topoisomerase [Lachnospiraceae bacterium]MCI2195269.1 DNA topoisomerase [Lachnospiraceae bacterium]